MPFSVDQPFTTGMRRSTIAWQRRRSASSGWWRARSSSADVWYASARMASVSDFMVRSIRFTSGCWTMGEVFAPLTPTGLPCSRSRAHASARWYARSPIATPSSPTERRAAFIMMNMYSRPRFASPTM